MSGARVWEWREIEGFTIVGSDPGGWGYLGSFLRQFPVWLLGALGMAGRGPSFHCQHPPPPIHHLVGGRVQESRALPTFPFTLGWATYGRGFLLQALAVQPDSENHNRGMIQSWGAERPEREKAQYPWGSEGLPSTLSSPFPRTAKPAMTCPLALIFQSQEVLPHPCPSSSP